MELLSGETKTRRPLWDAVLRKMNSVGARSIMIVSSSPPHRRGNHEDVLVAVVDAVEWKCRVSFRSQDVAGVLELDALVREKRRPQDDLRRKHGERLVLVAQVRLHEVAAKAEREDVERGVDELGAILEPLARLRVARDGVVHAEQRDDDVGAVSRKLHR